MTKRPIIAIDGTAASGKTTTARRVAEHFHYLCVDTGSMYRAITLKALQKKVDVSDAAALSGLVDMTDIAFVQGDGSVRVLLDHVDVTEAIRSPQVTEHVSAVSEVKHVRDALVARQRDLGSRGGVVMEGRDIGTVVFPDADVKIFMVADIGERVKRRGAELEKKGLAVTAKTMEETLLRRDEWDSTRKNSPLRKAADAQVVNTTHLTIEDQVEAVIRKVERFLQRGESRKGA